MSTFQAIHNADGHAAVLHVDVKELLSMFTFHFAKIRILFQSTPHLWISFPIIIFSSARRPDGAAVGLGHRRRNCAVGIFLLAGR